MKKEAVRVRSIRIQPESPKEDPLKMPYPYFINEAGEVGRQDFWKGSPLKLVGFNGAAKNETVEPACGLEDFLKDPKQAIGKYPIFEHADGEWFTYKDRIASVDEKGV